MIKTQSRARDARVAHVAMVMDRATVQRGGGGGGGRRRRDFHLMGESVCF